MFAELRELLSAAPSEQGFKKVIGLLNEWSTPDDFEMAMQYAEDHLKDWHDMVRRIVAFDSLQMSATCLLARSIVYREHSGFEAVDFSKHQYLANMKSIDASRLMNAGGLPFDSPYLGNLGSLYVKDCYLDDDAAIAIANSPHMSNLKYLDLSHNEIGSKGIQAIATSPYLRLDTLRMEYNRSHISWQDQELLNQSYSVKHYSVTTLDWLIHYKK